MLNKSLHFFKELSSIKYFFWSLLWLMFLVVVGTLAQKDIGLYLAQNKFFSSWILWIWHIPFPGGTTVLAVIFLGLLSQLIFKTKFSSKKLGIAITHLGAFLLIFGGLLTGLFSYEGNMVLPEGETSNYFEDYHAMELAIVNTDHKDKNITTSFGESWLKVGKVLEHASLPFKIKIVKFCRNCAFNPREGDKESYVGFAKNFSVNEIPEAKEDVENRGGLEFIVNGSAVDGNYALIEALPVQQTLTSKDGKNYFIEIRHKRHRLPFSIQLIDFEKKVHAGTEQARSFKSVVNLIEGDLSQRTVIQMNEPLRYKGYTLYQASFAQEGMHETSVLTVVKNVGRLFPYISSIIICFGILIHLILNFSILFKKDVGVKQLVLLLCILGSSQVSAEDKLSFNHFSIIPILAEGRIKPLDTFARVTLLGIYQKSTLKEQSPSAWLAELLFDQDKAFRHRVFKIKNPEVVNALSLEANDQHIYSFAQLVENFKKISPLIERIFQMEASSRTPVQKQLLDLYLKVVNFQKLSESVTLLIPSLEVPDLAFAEKTGLPFGKKITYLEVLKRQSAISGMTDQIFKKKKEELTESDFKTIQFIETLEKIAPSDGAKDFRVIPPQFSVSIEKEWLAPWPVLTTGMGTPQTVELFNLWSELYVAYKDNNTEAFEKTSEKIYQTTINFAGVTVSPVKLKLEKFYNQYDLFVKAIAFYILSFLLLAASSLGKKNLLVKLSFYALCLGAIPHFFNLALRCYLKSRPPVTTLYESVLFVAMIAVIGAILIEIRKKSSVGTFVGSILGTILLFISFGYEKEGDSMGMLVAVLDTNFWLATHVVSITIGYGCCFVLSVLGHVYLIWNMFPLKFKKSTSDMDSLLKSMQGTSLFALFFSVLGTILGGIWADQSWGRFWGWDPKENGALLICLWLLFAIHGRMLGYFKKNTLAMVMTVTSIIVVLAWFGVNLLNVGLHSYGFTDSIAINILIFSLLEITFIILASWKIKDL